VAIFIEIRGDGATSDDDDGVSSCANQPQSLVDNFVESRFSVVFFRADFDVGKELVEEQTNFVFLNRDNLDLPSSAGE
jgi:hypothetical protein